MAMSTEQLREYLEKAAAEAKEVRTRTLAAGFLLLLEELRKLREALAPPG